MGRRRSWSCCSLGTRRCPSRLCVAEFSTTHTCLTSWSRLIRSGVCLGTGIPTLAPPTPSPLRSRLSCENGSPSKARSVMAWALISRNATDRDQRQRFRSHYDVWNEMADDARRSGKLDPPQFSARTESYGDELQRSG